MVAIKTLLSVAVAVAATSCLVIADDLPAASLATAPTVTYVASGMFAGTPVSGGDVFELAGQPFSISVVANAATVPTNHGGHWASYTQLKLTGSVTSGLEPTPVAISSTQTSIELATGNPDYDVFVLFAPVNVIGLQINVQANIHMPPDSMTTALIHPFPAVELGPADMVIYTDASSGGSTTLRIAQGTLAATIPGSDRMEAPASVQLHAGGAQVITAHTDGTQSVRSIGGSAINLGLPEDAVVLQFYATGVSGAAEVRAQIAGETAQVLYAGPSGHFPGLDQISMQVPRSLAGRGDADVTLTVDGRTSNPVQIHIE